MRTPVAAQQGGTKDGCRNVTKNCIDLSKCQIFDSADQAMTFKEVALKNYY